MLHAVRIILCLTMVFAYLFQVFLKHPIAPTVVSILTAAVILVSFPYISRVNRVVSSLLFIAGTYFLFANSNSISAYLKAIRSNTGLLSFFVVVPILSIPFRFEKYQQALKMFYNANIKSKKQFYLFTSVISYFFSALVNVAAIPIVLEIVSVNTQLAKDRILPKVLLRGFTASALWAPSFLSVALVLSLTNVDWLELLPPGLFLSVVFVLFGWILEFNNITDNFNIFNEDSLDFDRKSYTKYINQLLITFILLFASIIFFNEYTSYGILVIVPIASILFPLLWTIATKQKQFFKNELQQYIHKKLPDVKNELVLFGIAGYIGHAISQYSNSSKVFEFLQSLNTLHPVIFSFLIIIIIIAVALIGLHPLVSVTTLAALLSTLNHGFSNVYLALTYLSGYTLAVILSPFSATILVTSGLFKISPFKIGLKANLIYSLLCALISSLCIGIFFF